MKIKNILDLLSLHIRYQMSSVEKTLQKQEFKKLEMDIKSGYQRVLVVEKIRAMKIKAISYAKVCKKQLSWEIDFFELLTEIYGSSASVNPMLFAAGIETSVVTC